MLEKNIRILSCACLVAAGALWPCAVNAASAEEDLKLFSRKLFEDIENLEAREFFRQSAKDGVPELKAEKMRLLYVTELLAYVDFLKQRLVNLTGAEVDLSALGKEQSSGGRSLDDVIKKLSAIKYDLVKRIEEAQLKKVQLRTKRDSGSQGFGGQAEDLNVLRVEVEKLQKQLEDLQNRMESSDKEIARLTDNLAAKTLEAFEKDGIISRQKEDLFSLEKRVNEAQERVRLGQRLVQEKNDRIAQLQMPQENEVIGLRDQLEQLQEDFKAQTKDNKLRMSVLEQLLAQQEKRIAEYALELKLNGERVEYFSSMLLEKSRQLSEMNAVLQSKDQKLLEMDGIIQIYKGKLTESNKMLREKIHHIQDLEKQLVQTRQHIHRSKRDLEGLDDQLIFLKERILSLP